VGQDKPTALLLQKYQSHLSFALSEVSSVDGWYTRQINDMSLREFVLARQEYCQLYHIPSCTECTKLISAAKDLIREKVIKLQTVYEKIFGKQGSKYKTDKAVERLMQLPVVTFPVKEHQRVTIYVTEPEGLNCSKVQRLIQNFLEKQNNKASELSKATLCVVCDLASSGKDKKLIKYTALLISGISLLQAKKLYGIPESTRLKSEVSQALKSGLL